MTTIFASVMLASCSYHHQLATTSLETKMPQTWFLVVAPFSREFPGGDLQAPISKWPQVTTFDRAERCESMLVQATNDLQRPVQCVASDDPRLNEAKAASGNRE